MVGGRAASGSKPASTFYWEAATGVPASQSMAELGDLPQTRIKRNYHCSRCYFFTQNPRSYLYHLKEEHGEKLRIYECQLCIYASRHNQKLQRHLRMVHDLPADNGTQPLSNASTSSIMTTVQGNSPQSKEGGKAAASRSSRSSSDSNSMFIPSPKSPKRSTRRTGSTTAIIHPTPPKSSSYTTAAKRMKHKIEEEIVVPQLVEDDEEEEELDEDNDSSGATAEADMMEEDYFEAEEAAAIAADEERSSSAYHHSFRHSVGKSEELRCSVCDFVTKSRVLLQRHERLVHLKKKFFRCVKCNYVTHVKARYTKHVKYHSMPMIKCDMCEFRTPYKWNLDRHLKNHMGGGMYQCSLCNFTAHIKQSLTVHIQNHHLTPERARVSRRRNKVGASDEADASMDAEELDLLRLEREEDLPDIDDLAAPEDHEMSVERHGKSSTPPMALTVPKNASDTGSKSDSVFGKHAQCRFCSFKAVWDSEIQQHEERVHGIPVESASASLDLPREAPTESSFPKAFNKPPPRPIPNLIPIGSMLNHTNSPQVPSVTSTPAADKATPTILRIPQIPKRAEFNTQPATEFSPPILEAVGLLAKTDAEKFNALSSGTASLSSDYIFPWNTNTDNAKDSPRGPKNAGMHNPNSKTTSFFDQLAEKLAPTNINQLICQFCGHEAKCLSEAVRHQKLHSGGPRTRPPLPPPNPTSLSSRCQYCRHRCKTRLDLLTHLKTCPAAQLAMEEEQNDLRERNFEASEELKGKVQNPSSEMDHKQEPHPMENKVFVWNQPPEASLTSPTVLPAVAGAEGDAEDGVSVASDLSESSMVGIETIPGIGTVTGGMNSSNNAEGMYRKVYRCPHCNFWANTASRFHVHIVGHSNTKPFECSQCNYRSNWRWDITKHIKLKTVRDPDHQTASVVMLDPAGERHHQQYDQYLTTLRVMESSTVNSSKVLTVGRSASLSPSMSPRATPSPAALSPVSASASLEGNTTGLSHMRVPQPPKLTRAPTMAGNNPLSSLLRQPPPLTALRPQPEAGSPQRLYRGDENRRTVWKCKRCIFKDGDRDKVVEHISSVHYGGLNPAPSTLDQDLAMAVIHSTSQATPLSVPPFQSSLLPTPVPAFRCGVCNQVSNWKHVIQRHCRLKHNGNIQVVENRLPEDDGPVLTKESHWSAPSSNTSLSFFGKRGRGGGRMSLERKVEIARQSAEEDGLGYILHPDRQQYLCSTCPFACRSLTDMELHRRHHNSTKGFKKCRLCTYNTTHAADLTEHLQLHGVENPTDHSQEAQPEMEDESTPEVSNKRHKCPQCPYVSDSKSQFLYHKQFHRPRGAPFKCTQCSYNVSRRHLLNQHLRVHGLPPLKVDSSETASTTTALASNASYASDSEAGYDSDNGLEIDEEVRSETSHVECNNASPAKTETSLESFAPSVSASTDNNNFAHLNLNPQRLPRLTDTDTRSLPDIPLTWVSRPDGKFCKMFKCRFCPHVNFRKVNIQEHEKRHQNLNTNTGSVSSNNNNNNNNFDLQRCHLCNYHCNNAGVLSAHVKVHQNILGVIHGLVDPTVSDEDQLQTLAALGDAQWDVPTTEDNTPRLDLLLQPRSTVSSSKDNSKNQTENDEHGSEPDKLLHFCQNCPARFLNENELVIHEKFHIARFTHRCDMCSYTARQKHHLMAHLRVHSREYQDRTQFLLQQYPVSDLNPQPHILAVQSADPSTQPIDLSAHAGQSQSSCPSPNSYSNSPSKSSNTSSFQCSVCPATFCKLFALDYHNTLHGGEGPYKCKLCDYAVKTAGNLAKHENLHKKSSNSANEDENVPLSGVELALQIQNLELPHQEDPLEDEFGHEDEEMDGLEETNEEEDSGRNSQYSKNGRLRAKRFKCSKCPSAFEKREQYDIHLSLHGSKQHYRCDKCDYAVKYYANYLQHIRKHDIHEALTNNRDSELEEEPEPFLEPCKSQDPAEDESLLSQSTQVILSIAEQQHLMLQKQGIGGSGSLRLVKDDSTPQFHPKKWFACHLCPYSAPRKEFVESHGQRHERNGGAGAFKCDFCDYRAAQKHLLREHCKWHFKSRKQWAKLDGYLHYSNLTVTGRSRKHSGSAHEALERLFSTEDHPNPAIPLSDEEEDDDDRDNLVIDLSTGETVANPVDCEESEDETKEKDIGGIPDLKDELDQV